MNIEKNIRDDHQAELTVEVETERMEAAKRRAARKLSERGKIPGFRPGKAPYEMVRRHYGDEAIVEQAIDLLVDEIYPEALKQAEIEPAAPGMLEKIESVDPPKFIFRVPLMPTVDLGDYLSMRVPYEWNPPGQKELDETLENIRRVYATTETVERAIQEGDYVLISVKGRKEGAAENEEDEGLSGDNTAVMVRAADEQRDDEWPFKGFARELIGLKPGETKTITHKYPGDEKDETLRNAVVTFDVTIKNVRAAALPELNDDFAKMVSEKYETLDQLKEAVQQDIETRSRAEYDDQYFNDVLDKMREFAVIKYPPQVLEHESEHVLEDLRQRLAGQNMDLETFYKVRGTTPEKFMEEEVRPVAARRLERGLILDEIVRRHKIQIDMDALHEEFTQTIDALAYTGVVDLERLNKSGKAAKERFSNAVASVSANRLMTRRALEKLKAIALGEWKPEDDAPKAAESQAPPEETAPGPEVKEETSADTSTNS